MSARQIADLALARRLAEESYQFAVVSWKRILMHALEVSEGSARRMANGRIPIPQAEYATLAALIRAEAQRLNRVAAILEEQPPC